MKAKFSLLISIVAFLAICSCSSNNFKMKDISGFFPSDKYFIANMISLHYVIETQPIKDLKKSYDGYSKMFGFPEDAKRIKDGRYYGESPEDAFGYRHCVSFRVLNGKFLDIKYNEIKGGGLLRRGLGKKEDTLYCKSMDACGTNPSIAYPIYEQQLEQKQNLSKVDAVSGATYSYYRFRYAVSIALMKAIAEQKVTKDALASTSR